MATTKRPMKIYDESTSEWIVILPQTSGDIVSLTGDDANVQAHVDNTVKHTTQTEKDKLANLPADANATFIPVTQKGAASGVVPLTADGKIAAQYIDPTAVQISKEVATIAAMLALTASDIAKGQIVLVDDATGDPTVTTGWAMYLKKDNTTYDNLTGWLKYAEGESLDIVLAWDNITGKPTSTPADIDAVVGNKTVLVNLTDIGGKLAYKGTVIDYGNKITLSDTEPTDKKDNDLWFGPEIV